jgi:PAS domain S-box-containing protein
LFPPPDHQANVNAADVQMEAEQRFEDLVNSIDAIVWESDPKGVQFTFVSAQAEPILGYKLEDWYTEGFWAAHIHPHDRERALHQRAAQIEAGNRGSIEYRMLADNGHVLWLKDSISIRAGSQAPLRGIILDISDLRRAHSALPEPAYFLQQLGDIIPSPIFCKDAEGSYQDCNTAFGAYIGIERHALLGTSAFDIAPQRDFLQDHVFTSRR